MSSDKKTHEIAYMITVYMEPQSLKKLIEALECNEVDFYIHIDKKVNRAQFQSVLQEMDNVYFLRIEECCRVKWGGYSQVKAQYNLIKAIQKSGYKYKRVVSLTGTDYPIKSNKELIDIFNKTDKEYIIGYRMSDDKKQMNKVRYIHCMDTFNIIYGTFEHLKISKGKISEKYDFFFGSEYWGLTLETLNDLISMWEKDKKLQLILKYSFVPSEIWIHTLFFNSKYKSKGEIFRGNYKGLVYLSPLTFFEYYDKIKILTLEDYDIIKKSNQMFMRKNIKGVSDLLVDKIEIERGEQRNE